LFRTGDFRDKRLKEKKIEKSKKRGKWVKMKGNTGYKENEQKRRKSRSRRGNFQKTF
jgi:hypothetical protein